MDVTENLSEVYGVVYKVTNLNNGKIYVGKSTRKGKSLDEYLGSGRIIIRAVKKYGRCNFIKEILTECYSKEELCYMEEYYIDLLNSTDRNVGYNIYKDSRGLDSETAKLLLANPEIKEKHSKSVREAMSRPETKENQRRASKLMHSDPEFKLKRSASLKESQNRPEVLKKISEASIRSNSRPDIKKNISDNFLKLWNDPEYRAKMIEKRSGENSRCNKKVKAINLDTGELKIFSSIKNAREYFNVTKRVFSRIIHNQTKTSKLLPWVFELENKE